MAIFSRTYPHLLSGLYPWPHGRNPKGKVWGYKCGWIPDPALRITRKNTKEVKAVVEEVKVMALVYEIKAKADEERFKTLICSMVSTSAMKTSSVSVIPWKTFVSNSNSFKFIHLTK